MIIWKKMRLKDVRTHVPSDLLYYVVGSYVLASFLLNMMKNYIHHGSFLHLLWYCDFIAIVLGIGLLLKNKRAVTISFVTSIPAQSLWVVDFFLELFSEGFGRTSFIFNEPLWVIALTTNLHLIIIPASIYAVYRLGFARDVLMYIILITVVILTASYLLSDLNTNINCVYFGCDAPESPHGEEKSEYLEYFIFNSLLFWVVVMTVTYFGLSYAGHLTRYLLKGEWPQK